MQAVAEAAEKVPVEQTALTALSPDIVQMLPAGHADIALNPVVAHSVPIPHITHDVRALLG